MTLIGLKGTFLILISSKFLKWNTALQERLRTDEEELLRFAFRYLKYMLRLGSTLTIKSQQGCPGQQCPQKEK